MSTSCLATGQHVVCTSLDKMVNARVSFTIACWVIIACVFTYSSMAFVALHCAQHHCLSLVEDLCSYQKEHDTVSMFADCPVLLSYRQDCWSSAANLHNLLCLQN